MPVTRSKALMIDGIRVTHGDRIISKIGNVTKRDVVEYYSKVSRLMMPAIEQRPLTLFRCPEGIDAECFYQRAPGLGLGARVHTFTFRHKGSVHKYLYIDDAAGLLTVVQMNAIEVHPWGSRVDEIELPDRMIFDLDPAPDVSVERLKDAARELRALLRRVGLSAMLKTTGGKGLHVTVPLQREHRWPQVKAFAMAIAQHVVRSAPDEFVATMTKARRKGKIFIDVFRNDATATAVADYSVRARPGAPVATPIRWEELDDLESASQFTIDEVLKRIAGRRRVPTVKPQRLSRRL